MLKIFRPSTTMAMTTKYMTNKGWKLKIRPKLSCANRIPLTWLCRCKRALKSSNEILGAAAMPGNPMNIENFSKAKKNVLKVFVVVVCDGACKTAATFENAERYWNGQCVSLYLIWHAKQQFNCMLKRILFWWITDHHNGWREIAVKESVFVCKYNCIYFDTHWISLNIRGI